MLLRWLRKKLRQWILEEKTDKVNTLLECAVDGKVKTYHISGRVGLMLRGRCIQGVEERIIRKGEAIDQEQYDELVRYFLRGATIEWEE